MNKRTLTTGEKKAARRLRDAIVWCNGKKLEAWKAGDALAFSDYHNAIDLMLNALDSVKSI